MQFYGWRIVAVAMLANALGMGLLGIYAFVATPIVQEFGASDAQIGMGMSILVLCVTLASPLLGPALDRGRIRGIMLCGVALMLGAAWLLSRSPTLSHLAVLFAVVSLGLAMYGHLPITVLILNWFEARRGTALALGAAGMSLSGFFVPPLSAWLVTAFGWRDAIAYLATGAALVAFPAIALWVVRRPEDLGQLPDGRAPDAGSAPPPPLLAGGPAPETGTRELLRDPNFWILGFGFAIAMCVAVSSLFFVRHMEALGIGPGRASLLLAGLSVLSLVGKLGSGLLVDRVSGFRDLRSAAPRCAGASQSDAPLPSDLRSVAPRRAAPLCVLTVGVLLLYGSGWVLLAIAPDFGGMLVAFAPLGLAGGALLPLPAVLVGACFGRGLVGRVAGLHAPLGLPFVLASPPLVGMARDHTGDYTAPFLALAGVLALAALILSFVRIPAPAARLG